MLSDKEIKREFLKKTVADPDKYYATAVLKQQGFKRKKCVVCSRYFWTVNEDQVVCGDSACQGKISIFEDNPSSHKLSFSGVWDSFKSHFKDRGYVPVNRYPVVARWNPTTDFTMASIAAFQPYVVSGEVQPIAEKLVIPQFCLRFNDVDNVGITGSHCTGFVMLGQHQFVSEASWDQNRAFEDLLSYLTDVIGLSKQELTLHEDAWAGGGNFGPCMEFFSRGVELCNQVYMLYEQTPSGPKELDIKVLDMGLGLERVAWFTQGTPTLYDAAFPKVIDYLKEKTGVVIDSKVYTKFAPYATLLNLDEVDDIDSAWRLVASKIGIGVDELKLAIRPARALYSVAEHARSLLVAISDGALPGNVGGYYNLRVIFRRAQDFIEDFGWDVSLFDVTKAHADELSGVFPELLDSLDDVKRIFDVELEKYYNSRSRAESIVKKKLPDVSVDDLLLWYDSYGITPEQVKLIAKKEGVNISVPDDFYKLLSEKHSGVKSPTATKSSDVIDVSDVDGTEPLFYQSYDLAVSDAIVVKVEGRNVLLDRTIFYPTSGGQLHDTGTINGIGVVNVIKQGRHIVHVLEKEPDFKPGDRVKLEIDIDRRIQLAQHHTAAHVINGAARLVLGNHVWQAGAAKTPQKGRLDITHYSSLSDEELKKIEAVANDIIRRDLPVIKSEMKRSVAEQRFGFRLYQGGVVPGDTIRVVDIPGFDTEACGGTHVNATSDLQLIKILKATKVQDGVVRIEYVAGRAAHEFLRKRRSLEREVMELLGVDDLRLVPGRVSELFSKWKKFRKLTKKKQPVPDELLVLSSKSVSSSDDPLSEAASLLSVNVDVLPNTIRKFLRDLKK